MDPHSSRVSGEEVILKYGWYGLEETRWHHESWQRQANLEMMEETLLK